MKPLAILFDLDGTLVDSVPDIALASNAMLSDLGHSPLSLTQIRDFVGKGTAVLIKRLLCAKRDYDEPDPSFFQKAQQCFNQHYHATNGTQSQCYPTVIASLTRFQAAGIALAVVTNKPQEFTLPLLEKLGLSRFFTTIVCGDTCPQKKPSPDPLFHACHALNVPVERCIFVGDSLNDTQAAQAAKMPVFVLPYGYNEGRDIHTLKATGVIDNLSILADNVLSS